VIVETRLHGKNQGTVKISQCLRYYQFYLYYIDFLVVDCSLTIWILDSSLVLLSAVMFIGGTRFGSSSGCDTDHARYCKP
jgi:hypothetical protein